MNGAIARRYAKALIEAAQEGGRIEETGEELKRVVEFLRGDESLKKYLTSALCPSEIKKRLMGEIADALGISNTTKKFLELIGERKRINLIEAIYKNYMDLEDDILGNARVHIITAIPLSEAKIEALREALEILLGKRVIISCTQDEAIMGGIICKIDSTVLDGSLRTQLEMIREKLIKE